MKKLLLLLSLGCIGATMSAEFAPKTFDLTVFQKMSPDGRYVVSEFYGSIQIFDLVENTSYDYIDPDGMMTYTAGMGNSFNAQNVFVGCAETDANAAYWKDGEWHSLPLVDETAFSNIANGITPDGSRICGTVGQVEKITLDDALMSVPAIWNLNADGTYDQCVTLPHPTTDFLGKVPQYITALAISDDGKTVAGTITDCAGRLVSPIVFTEDADGEWSYKLPMERFCNPDKLELPEDPGEYPSEPDPTTYMTEEKAQEYNDAYNEWMETWQGDAPDPKSYMTEEQIAEYDAAKAAYETAVEEYDQKQEEYYGVLDAIYTTSTGIEFNNIGLTPDGKKIVVSTVTSVPDPNSWFGTKEIPHVWVIDLETEEIFAYEDAEANFNAINADGSITAWGDINAEEPTAYILKDGVTTSFYDYLTAISPECKEWVDENMKHEVEVYDYETEELTTVERICVGYPLFSADNKVVACWTPTPWDWGIMYQGYVFNFNETDAVKAIATSDLRVGVNKAGEIVVKGTAASLEVFNLQGVCVFKAANVSGVVAESLPAGAYIVKATAADGLAKVAKVVK